MQDAHEFLRSLTVVLAVAAITTVVFQRLRQPVVLGYIIAGSIVGPHVPIPLVADPGVVQTLSELGVILLMFSLGLEFSLRKLMAVGPTAGLTALLQSSLMVWLGFTIGRLFGWTPLESLFAGAVIAISSTTIIAKAFEEQGITGKLRELVVGVLIVEDLIAVLLMAVLTAVASGSGLAAGPLVATIARLAAFLVGLVGIGPLLVPRAMRAISRLNHRETTLVARIGICFTIALLAQSFGYSVALGAFLAGSLVAESGEEKQVEHLVEPVRDMFGAVFFVSVGMLIDPALVARHWLAVVVLTAAVIIGKVVGVSLGAFLTGSGMRTSVQAGLSLAQIGEFSFIIAALGLALHATGEFLYPVAVAVSALTTLLTPWMIRASEPIAAWVDRKLPRPLQTFAALYGSWLEELRARRPAATAMAGLRRLLRLLVLDAALIAALIVATSASIHRIVAFARDQLGMSEVVARWLVVAAAVALSAPFCIGVVQREPEARRDAGPPRAPGGEAQAGRFRRRAPPHAGRHLPIGRRVAGRHAALGAHPAVSAGGVGSRRARPARGGARGGVLAERHQPPGSRPRRRRSGPRGARRAVSPAPDADLGRYAGTGAPAVARPGSARRRPARLRERRHRTHARPGEPARTHGRHRPGDHPDPGRRARADRGRAAAGR